MRVTSKNMPGFYWSIDEGIEGYLMQTPELFKVINPGEICNNNSSPNNVLYDAFLSTSSKINHIRHTFVLVENYFIIYVCVFVAPTESKVNWRCWGLKPWLSYPQPDNKGQVVKGTELRAQIWSYGCSLKPCPQFLSTVCELINNALSVRPIIICSNHSNNSITWCL